MKYLNGAVPEWALYIIASVAGVGLLILAGVLIAAAGRRAGQQKTTYPPRAGNNRNTKDRALFLSAILAGAIVYGAVVIGSFEGLTGFARDTLGWKSWQQFLVPVSLDGVALAFGVLAFRAISRRMSPYRCYRIVWGAAAASASFNFIHGREKAMAAGLYLAFLSFVAMAMFHTFLDQFQSGAAWKKREYPSFGARWVTYLVPTVLAFLAWVNHPPAEGTPATVGQAVEHLERVRERKRATRRAKRERRAEDKAHAAGLAGRSRRVLDDDGEAGEAPRAMHLLAVPTMHPDERFEAATEAGTKRPGEAGEAPRQAPRRSGLRSRPSTSKRGASKRPNTRLSDDEAVAELVAKHPHENPSKRAASVLLGAGFGPRLDRLLQTADEVRAKHPKARLDQQPSTREDTA